MIMTQEDKELLLKDLCARLPYGVKANSRDEKKTITITAVAIANFMNGAIDIIKPYLRPLSSMTEEEYNEMNELVGWSAEMQLRTNGLLLWLNVYESVPTIWMVKIFEVIDWLNAHHFDYRGLIEQGLAIEVTEDNNPYKN